MQNLLPYLPAIPFFAYLVYIIGRTYITAYLSQLGVPEIVLSTNEYIFYGTKIDNLAIAFAFTFVLIGLIRCAIYKPNDIHSPGIATTNNDKGKKPTLSKVDKFFISLFPYLATVNLFTYAILFILSLIIIVFKDAPHPLIILYSILLPSIILICFNLFIIFGDYSYVVWVKSKKRLSIGVVIVLIIQLAFFPSVTSTAWGASRGYYDSDNLRTVKIISETQLIEGDEWSRDSQGNYYSGNLSLIYMNNEFVIVKSSDNTTKIISVKDISSININDQK